MLNPQWLRTLKTVVAERGFQAAAESLGIAQPTVSLHISKLEQQLRVALIKRNKTACYPTEAAKRLLPFVDSILNLSQQAINAIRTDCVRVGSSSNIGIYMLQPHIRSYIDKPQSSQIELTIDDNPTIVNKMANFELDIAIVEWWQPLAGFVTKIWKVEPLVLITSPQHPLGQLDDISLEQLQTISLIGGERGTGTGRILSEKFTGDLTAPKISMQLGSTEAVKQAVKENLGVSLVSASTVTEEVTRGTLSAVPVAGGTLNKTLIIVQRKEPQLDVSQQSFVEHLYDDVSNPRF
ncbi:LysR family transcriptional regulator [Methylophaga sp.]|uniref:LysR family transcriptional regulator n=1 Tax=Methylophaga sp. TaxID=2024840 RepID=UPI003F6A189F